MSDLGEILKDYMERERQKATREFIESAKGTCNSVDETLAMIDCEDEDLIDWGTVDEEIFRCETCSWWCEIHEQDSNGNCSDCSTKVECEKCFNEFDEYEMTDGLCPDCAEND